jgi:hypothetical protein
MIRKRRFPNYLTTIGIDLGDLEWESPKVSAKVQKKLRARADKIGKKLAADWLAEAKKQLAEMGANIAADEIDQQRRDQIEASRAASEREIASIQKQIDRMVAAELPTLKAEAARLAKQRRGMNKAVQRERQKLEAAGMKLARLKLARFRNRR